MPRFQSHTTYHTKNQEELKVNEDNNTDDKNQI